MAPRHGRWHRRRSHHFRDRRRQSCLQNPRQQPHQIVFAAKRNVTTSIRGAKSLYYIGGLTEGTETIALFIAICLFPDAFPWLAWGFGALCWITTAARIAAAAGAFRPQP